MGSGNARAGATGDQQAATPRATRQSRARVLDPRLAGGAALLLVSAFAGALLLTRTDDTVTVWRAARDLSVGAVPRDVVEVTIPRTVGADVYVDAREAIDAPLRWPVAAGALVPRAAIGSVDGPVRRVTVPVDPLHAPVELLPGDVVDVWSSPAAPAGSPTATSPRLVLPGVVVAGVSDDGLGLGGERAVVLEIPRDAVEAVVAATHDGAVDLVAVPIDDQVPPA